jgi:glycosyltransferase involved in cell wall biosynthesis
LEAQGNVHFLGARPFERLSTYLRGFDVCMLPHAVTPLTQSMDPIKLYDYLASGKPIVSSDIAGVDRFVDVIRVGDNASEFIAAIEQAIAENGALRERKLYYAHQNTWSARTAEMWKVMRAQMTEKGVGQWR